MATTATDLHSSSGGLPRWLEAILAATGLLAVSPLLAVAALAIKLSTPGPALFRQQRVGRDGRPFTLYKLRSMTVGNDGPGVTAGGDARITRLGALLRRSKLDELPELWNVVRGDMSLVGARPEVPQFVNLDDKLWQETLSVRPGLTDPVTLALRDEESLLRQHAEDPERFYRDHLLPRKLAAYIAYLNRRSPWTDCWVLVWTAFKIALPNISLPTSLRQFDLSDESQSAAGRENNQG